MNCKITNYIKITTTFILVLFFISCQNKNNPIIQKERLVDKVYPLLDTENSRWFFFSSASRPFGMVNLSPDTEIKGAWDSGYRYKTDTIKGFSHIHAWQMSGLSIMPITVTNENESKIFSDFYSVFSHNKETVTPGYHSLELDRYQIKAELTSTKRVGFHKYTFPKQQDAGILFNLNTILGPCDNVEGSLQQTGTRELSGKLVASPTHRRPKPVTIYFQIKVNVDIKELQKDNKTGNYIILLDKTKRAVLLKAGISYTSIKNASINIEKELPHWNFDQVVEESKNEWESYLGRIKIKGGTLKAQQRFYTDLWHALLGRRVINDVNGSYPDNTGNNFKVGQLPLNDEGKPLFNHYNSDSFWGAQWTINTLWGLAYPDIMEEFSYSLLQYYKDGGLIPRGPSGGNYTYVMTGASSTPFIVSAIQKGIIKKDIDLFYSALKTNHELGGIMERVGYEHTTQKGGGLSYYLDKGYVPYPLPDGKFGSHQDGASLTLEYAYQDWTLAQLAKKIGNAPDYKYYMKRSKNYQNLFDTTSGWIRPKNINGKWYDNFDAYQYQHGFIEANGAQATWFVPHDINGLANLMGGKEKAAEKLNAQFIEAEKMGFTSGNSHAAELHPEYRRIPINYGNQPSIQTAFIFEQLGRPDLTQYWARKIVDSVFSGLDSNTGYNGDEDQGLMGSLAVLMKIGIFQMNGGTNENPVYQVGSPLFDEVTISLHKDYYKGGNFIIKAKNNSLGNVYAEGIKLNNNALESYKITHGDIIKGGILELQMTDKLSD